MSYTLYRKYRPKNFGEIIGQQHIVRTLSNAIKNNRVGQAYLFTGPRGTGKTSIARIFARAVNCANLVCEERADTKLSIRRSSAEADSKLSTCNSCDICQACKTIDEGRSLDIIEIDAASNTGVDNIRELRETVSLPPTFLKYKVYIIDEVHMLSTGAFNALLKTLEEPPTHVIFILATTEIHKVPETILSRCQRFDFARLPLSNIIEKLTLIAKSEKVSIDKDSLEMIALSAEGGMRDAESLLGQIIALEDKNITLKEVEEILGTTDRRFAGELAEMLFASDSTGAIAKINTLLTDGYDLQVFNKSLINYLRQLMLLKISPELKTYFSYEITADQIEKMLEQIKRVELSKIVSSINLFLEAQDKISASMLPQLPLEIAIIKATNTFPVMEHETYNIQQISNQSTKNNNQATHNSQLTNHKQSINIQTIEKVTEEAKTENSNLSIDEVTAKWHELLEKIAPFNHSLKALLSNCRVFAVTGSEITLATPYDFYMQKLNDPGNRLTVEDVFGKILESKIRIKTIIDKETNTEGGPARNASHSDAGGKQNSLLASAMEIIGGRLVGDPPERRGN
ncbi:MAG: DNA polymerase III subunit gamma/tau [Parcubacteria group bacterium]